MRNIFTILTFFIFCTTKLSGQNVGIGTNAPHPSAKLHIDANNAGILIPSLDLNAATFPAPGPATGLLVYNSNASYGGGIGFYFNSGTPATPVWFKILDASNTMTPDQDWYEANSTDSPDNISDNIYTQGNVGIGNYSSSVPSSKLDIKDVIDGGNAINVDMTNGAAANSVGLNINNFPSNANTRTGILLDMTNTSNSAGLRISNVGPTGMSGININSNSNGNGVGIRMGELNTLGTGINIRGGTGMLYNALSVGDGTAVDIGGTTAPLRGVSATVSGTNNIGGEFYATTYSSGSGLIGGVYSAGVIASPNRVGVYGFANSNSTSGTDIQYGSYSQSRRGGNSGTTKSYGSYSIAEGVNASNNGFHVATYGTVTVDDAGTGGGIAGQFEATSNSGRHLAIAATGGADVYLGSTDADRPSNFTGANVTVGTGNTNTTYINNARVSGNLLFRQTGAGSNTATIIAPSSITSSYTLTLPTAQGTSNQVLVNDGSGNLSWSSGGALVGAENGLNITSNNVRLGGALDDNTNIVLGNNNLNFTIGANTGKIGINHSTPLTYLDIRSNTPKSTTTATEYLFQIGSTTNTPLALRQGLAMHSTAGNRYASIEVDDNGSKRDLALQPTGGNVGIGVDGTVGTKLYVNDVDGNNLTLERSSTTADHTVAQYFKVHTGTVNTNRKGGIFFQRKAGNGVGNMIFAINSVNSTANVTTADARMTIASNGEVTIHNLGDGLVKSTSGVLSNATAGTDFENPLTFSNGLTRTTNAIKLGGALTETTTVSGLTATNKMSFTGTGVDAFNIDGTTLSVDASNNRVGIGLSNPNNTLSVNGTIEAIDFGAAGSQNIVIGDDAFLTDIDAANMTGLYGLQNSDRGGLRLGSNSGSYIYGRSGNIAVGNDDPQEKLHVSGNSYNTGAAVFQGFSIMEIEMVGNSDLGGPDNAYHTVTCPNGYAMTNLAIYSSTRLDGGERIMCVKVNDLITTNHTWRGRGGGASSSGSNTNTFDTGADNQDHSCSCNAGEVATGFEAYSNSHLDGRMKIRCTQLKSGYSLANNTTVSINGYTVRGMMANINVPWNTGRDDQYHISDCPAGTFVTGLVIRAASYLDGEMRCYCSGIKR